MEQGGKFWNPLHCSPVGSEEVAPHPSSKSSTKPSDDNPQLSSLRGLHISNGIYAESRAQPSSGVRLGPLSPPLPVFRGDEAVTSIPKEGRTVNFGSPGRHGPGSKESNTIDEQAQLVTTANSGLLFPSSSENSHDNGLNDAKCPDSVMNQARQLLEIVHILVSRLLCDDNEDEQYELPKSMEGVLSRVMRSAWEMWRLLKSIHFDDEWLSDLVAHLDEMQKKIVPPKPGRLSRKYGVQIPAVGELHGYATCYLGCRLG
jgi:hypothetical protein